MPPKSVPCFVEDFIFYYYAKLVIAPSAGFAGNYRFVMDTYKRLKAGRVSLSDYERELSHLAQGGDACALCGKRNAPLEPTPVVPKSLGGPLGIHNSVLACESCSNSKAEKDLISWWRRDLGRKLDDLPRVPFGLYLKIAYERHKIDFTLHDRCQDIENLFVGQS